MHGNQLQLDGSWSWVELVSEDAILSQWALTRSHDTAHTRTNTSSGVQTHIPLVGSWSKVRKCEICQPIGDWVIEEFDSERNILLPWWWTRRNVHVEPGGGRVKREKQKLIINTETCGVLMLNVGQVRLFVGYCTVNMLYINHFKQILQFIGQYLHFTFSLIKQIKRCTI